MDFELTFEKREKYIFIKGKGVRKDLTAVFESTQAFTKIVINNNMRFVLLDYSTVTTHSSNANVFNITRLYEREQVLSNICVACICNPDEFGLEKFWEDITAKRGYEFKVFKEAGDAERWLLKQVHRFERDRQ
ncbi:hypothetical protein BH09BAC3_BH09BAC3_08070 [soil metagenome]